MKVYVSSHNGVLEDYKAQIEYATPLDADKLVVWQDCNGSFKELVKACKKFFPKPVYVMQHGVRSSRDYDKQLNKKFQSDVFLAWGKWDAENMRRMGYKAEIVGCPLNKLIRPKTSHKEKVVLFVPVSTGKEEPDNIMVYNELLKMRLSKAQEGLIKNYEEFRAGWNPDRIKNSTICDDFTVVAKVLPWHDHKFYTDGIIKGYQDSVKNNEAVFSLLANVDCVVGLDEGTTELFAAAMDVPTVVVKGFEYRWSEGVRTQVNPSPAVTYVELKDLQNAVQYALDHPEHLREERLAKAENEMSIQSIKDPVSQIHKVIGSTPK